MSNDKGSSIAGSEASSISAPICLPGLPPEAGRITVPFSMWSLSKPSLCSVLAADFSVDLVPAAPSAPALACASACGSLITGSTRVTSVMCTLPFRSVERAKLNRSFFAVAISAASPDALRATPTSSATRSSEGNMAIWTGPLTLNRYPVAASTCANSLLRTSSAEMNSGPTKTMMAPMTAMARRPMSVNRTVPPEGQDLDWLTEYAQFLNKG